MKSITKFLFLVTFCFVQGNQFDGMFEKISDSASFDRVGMKSGIASVLNCAHMCVASPYCDGIQYHTNKTCLLLGNIIKLNVISSSLSASTYVRQGRLVIVSTWLCVFFFSLDTQLIYGALVNVVNAFPINSSHNQNTKTRNKHICVMITASSEGICVEFEKRTTKPWFSYIQFFPQVLHLF